MMILLFFLLSGNVLIEGKRDFFINPSFQPDKIKAKSKIRISFNDSIPDDTLTIYYSDANIPEAFSRNIFTAVCLDTVCKPVYIRLYWEPTGRYLGFSLPEGEKLTKKEHTPFTGSDYQKLNEILSDSSSLLGTLTPVDIHPVKKGTIKTDGITGATLPDLATWIVPEAAYTSYRLWHLAYGATRDTIVNYTKKHLLSNVFISNLLQDDDPYNLIKGLQWIGNTDLNPQQFSGQAIRVLHSQNYRSAGQAIRFLKNSGITGEQLQPEVLPLLDSEDFRVKYVAIEYFRECNEISQTVARAMIGRLNSDNYFLVNVILTLLEQKFHPNHEDQQGLAVLLNSKNINVANRVYHYLLNLPDPSPLVTKQLSRYRRKAL